MAVVAAAEGGIGGGRCGWHIVKPYMHIAKPHIRNYTRTCGTVSDATFPFRTRMIPDAFLRELKSTKGRQAR